MYNKAIKNRFGQKTAVTGRASARFEEFTRQ